MYPASSPKNSPLCIGTFSNIQSFVKGDFRNVAVYDRALNNKEIQSYLISDKKFSVLLNTDEQVQLSISFDLGKNTDYTWTSTNEAVAMVDSNGKITAIGAGNADIYAESQDRAFKQYIPVKVVEGVADELRLAVHLHSGSSTKLYLFDDIEQVVWRSMDESVATVDETGKVTGVSKGLAIIEAEHEEQVYQIYVRINE